MQHEWGVVDDKNPYDKTDRMKVPGGWIYRNCTLCDYQSAVANYAVTTVFVPDAS